MPLPRSSHRRSIRHSIELPDRRRSRERITSRATVVAALLVRSRFDHGHLEELAEGIAVDVQRRQRVESVGRKRIERVGFGAYSTAMGGSSLGFLETATRRIRSCRRSVLAMTSHERMGCGIDGMENGRRRDGGTCAAIGSIAINVIIKGRRERLRRCSGRGRSLGKESMGPSLRCSLRDTHLKGCPGQ